jgi:chromosome partitioning protein
VTQGPGARIIAIANQKGGVGKTTTAVNLGACLAEADRTVLVVDLDPQGNASTGLGVDPADRTLSTYEVLTGAAGVQEAAKATEIAGLGVVPSTIDLAGAEIELVSQFSRETRLARSLDPVRTDFDYILIDCPPSLGLLTVNGLAAADELLVPIQCEYYALEGLGQLMKNVEAIQANVNPRLRLAGIVLTMFDPRTRLADQVVEEVRRYFGSLVYDSVIPRSVRVAEAPGFGKPITRYDPESRGAVAYRHLARELAERVRVQTGDEDPPHAEDVSMASEGGAW